MNSISCSRTLLTYMYKHAYVLLSSGFNDFVNNIFLETVENMKYIIQPPGSATRNKVLFAKSCIPDWFSSLTYMMGRFIIL